LVKGAQVKDKPNKGFLKEISKPAKQETKKAFNYNKPVTKLTKIDSKAFNSRTREFKSVSPDKTTNFAVEQSAAKQAHKGNK